MSGAEKREQAGDTFSQLLRSGQVIGRVFFDLQDSTLDSKAKEELERVGGKLLELKGQIIMRIEGYSDSGLEKKGGIILSMQRAQAVKLYMSRNFPGLNVDFFMTGFGDTRPLAPEEGESVEDVRKKERRVDLVVYLGVSFFAEAEEVKVVTKLEELKKPPEEEKAEVVARVEEEKPPARKVPEIVEKVEVEKPAPRKEVEVVARVEEKMAPLKRVIPPPVLPERAEVVVAARSFRTFIFPEEFFDGDNRFREEARRLLREILGDARADSRWIFIAAAVSEAARAAGDLDQGPIRRQMSLAHELIKHQGIDADRIFIKGFAAQNMVPEDFEVGAGEVYLYVPLQ